MFHLGFEWPMSERAAFAKRLAGENWPPEWFSKATQGDEPWIFYMSRQFIDHVVTTLGEVLDGLAAFVRDELLPKLIALENALGQEGNCGTPKASIS